MKPLRTSVCAIASFVLGASCAPALAGSANVLLLGDDDAETQVQAALEAAGHVVVFAGPYYEWDGSGLDGIDVVVFLDGYNYSYGLTAEADDALDAFVRGGGGLVITEWAAYDVYNGWMSPKCAALMPVDSPAGDYDYGDIWVMVDPTHPMMAWLPPHWGEYEAEFSFVVPKPDATVLMHGRDGNPRLTYHDTPGGTVVHVNHDMTYSEDRINGPVEQLLVNAAEFAGGLVPADCNENETPDFVEIAADRFADVNRNRVLDACEADCNANGLPDEVDLDALLLAPVPFAFESGGLDWAESADDSTSGTVALPFAVDLGGETFVAFDLSSNGYVEMLRAGESSYGFTYGYVDELIEHTQEGGPRHTFLMAAYDDLSSTYGEYGYRLEANRAVFQWNTQTWCEDDDNRLSLFQIVLFDDGRVEWNFQQSDYTCSNHDLFTGIYLGHDLDALFEAIEDEIPAEESFAFDERGVLGGGSLDEDGDGIPDECVCPADLDGSGDVGFSDVIVLLTAWGECEGDCPEDLDGNGTVGFEDVLILLTAWGDCP